MTVKMVEEYKDVEDFLEHFGVKGMKWGVRKDRSSGGGSGDSDGEKKKMTISSVKAAGKKLLEKKEVDPEEAAKNTRVRVVEKGSVKRLSDAELKEAVSRLQMEKQYRDLKRPEVKEGEKAAKEVLINVGKTVATAYLSHVAFKGMARVTGLDLKPGKGDKKKDEKKD